jgi:FtsP/CotA-like multicopper oxidase with cupredoxin domain
VQYGNGVAGAIVVNGPASDNYDIDLGPYIITDWYHQTADVLQLKAEQATGPPPPSDNVLFNGTNINPLGSGGAYNKVVLTPGKKHLLRIINTSVENHFTVSLVGHTFKVIATDLVPVTPVVKSQLFLGIGQRYDVIIEANQAVGNYWFNATLGGGGLCGLSNNPYPAAIFSYTGAPNALPTNKGTPITADCHDTTGFTPVISRTADVATFDSHEKELSVNLTTAVTARGPVFSWQVNGSAIDVSWEKPILQYIAEGNFSFPRAANVVEITATSGWSYIVLDNVVGLVSSPSLRPITATH